MMGHKHTADAGNQNIDMQVVMAVTFKMWFYLVYKVQPLC